MPSKPLEEKLCRAAQGVDMGTEQAFSYMPPAYGSRESATCVRSHIYRVQDKPAKAIFRMESLVLAIAVQQMSVLECVSACV